MANTFRDVPLAADIIANSQDQLRQNMNYIVNVLGTGTLLATNGDHNIAINGVDNAATAGMHRQVTFIDRASNPAIPAGADTYLYSNGNSTYWRNSGGAAAIVFNASVGSPSISASNGYTFLPGPIGSGLMLQWGIKTVSLNGTATPITFSPNFASKPLNIQIACINTQGNSPSANNVYVKDGTVAITGFSVTNSSSGGITEIYWLAIGVK